MTHVSGSVRPLVPQILGVLSNKDRENLDDGLAAPGVVSVYGDSVQKGYKNGSQWTW